VKGHFLNAFLALLFSLLIWIAVGAQLSEEKTVTIHFLLRVGDEAAVRWKDTRATAELKVPMKVTLRGPREVVAQVTADKVVGRRNLTENAPALQELLARGRGTIPIRREDVSVPPQLEMVSTDPAELELGFEKVDLVLIQVEGKLAGELPPGLVVRSVSTRPSFVLVRGPKALIETGPQAYLTQPVDISRLRPPGGPIETGVACPEGVTTTSRVEVFVEVAPEPVQQAIRFPVLVLEAPRGKQLLPPDVIVEAGEGDRWVHEVTLEGPRQALDTLQARLEARAGDVPMALVRLDQVRMETGEDYVEEGLDVTVVGLPAEVRVVPEALRKFKIVARRKRP
jgi:hypothetical protein